MIHLVYGLPGTGKTTFLYQEIQKSVESNEKALLIVPEQQTVEVEATMSRLLPPSAQLSFEVLNFTRLANKLFRLYGGLSYHYITPGMKNLFMWRSMRLLTPFFKEYGENIASDRTMPATLLAAMGEFKAADVSPSALEKAAEKLSDASSLGGKLHDLSLLYTTYEALVAESYDDAANDLGKLAALLEEHDFFRGYHVYIDGFTDFTAVQYKIIKRIFSQAGNVTVSLLCDSPDTTAIHLSGIKKTSDRLRSYAGKEAKITCLSEFHRFTSPALAHLGRSLWDFSTSEGSGEPDERIALLSCADAYEEAKAVVSAVLSLVQSGYRYREIAVIARNADTYRGILDAEFEKAKIPYFMSEKTDITAKPLISMLFLAFAVKQRHFRGRDVIAYLKTGFGGFSDYETDIFEDYVSTWNISGKTFLDEVWDRNPDGYQREMSKRAEKILSVANETKNKLKEQLLPFFADLENAKTVGEFCQATYHFLQSLNISDRLREDAALALEGGDKKEAAETVGSFRALVGVLGDMTASMGEEAITLDEFTTAIRLVLDATDIGTIPTAADEVMIGSASMLRATGIRHAILIGLCEGEFPAKVTENGVFSDADRVALENIGLSLSGTGKEKAADELLYVYRAMTMPSEGLTLLYHRSNASGGACHPSLAFRRVKALLSPICEVPYASLPLEDRIFDKESALEELGGTRSDAALYEALALDPVYAALLSRRELSVCEPQCYVEDADQIIGNRLHLTQSRMETYVSCHFQYYCRYVLGLRENERAAFSYANIGTFIHRVLEVFMKQTGKETIDADRDMDTIKAIVSREIESYSKEIFKDGEDVSGRIAHLLVRLYRLSTLIAVNLCRERAGSQFTPRFFELPVGKAEGIQAPIITLDDGTQISLYGVIDRVDTYEKDGKLYVRVVDYKTGKKEFSMDDIREGFGVQLLLYLFAICDSDTQKLLHVPKETEVLPAGALYLSTAISKIETSPKEDIAEVLAKASGEIKRSGVLLDNEEILHAMSETEDPNVLAGIAKNKAGERKGEALTSAESFEMLREELYRTIKNISLEMKSGNASATPVEHGGALPCKYCNMKQFCRVDNRPCYDDMKEEA